ncbi:hypothetical protein [Streptomyces sp. NPDC088762]|uniref:hypothetical protein n=1 Tax=Streptomyces sp. NPDC088762 TaxID=3365891 RepID=UPI0038179BBB
MIKNIAAAAALAFGTVLLACAPAQAAPAAPASFPLPPYGFVSILPGPLGGPALLLGHPAHVVYGHAPLVVHRVY